jgi:hypothetical protein
MKNTIITICTIIGLLELAMIVIYFVIFNGEISTSNQDWDTFIQIFNGVIMTILTAVNIYVFYHLTVVIENKNQERAVKEKVFEAQSVITQMRVKQYEEVRTLIYDVISIIAKKKDDNGSYDLLHKKIAELDNSLLFKNYNVDDPSTLEEPSLKIIKTIQDIKANVYGIDYDDFVTNLTSYIKFIELYIVGQMITTDKSVGNYVCRNIRNVDCTISCAAQIFDRTLKGLKKTESVKQE